MTQLTSIQVREHFRKKHGEEKRGRTYWRSLEELSGTEEFRDMLHREFPRHASEWDASVDRRRFLQVAGAGMALAGLTACTRQPIEKIVPYVRAPEDVVPGKPLFFATARQHLGYATGLLAESHMGRPTKLEGNPDHPFSLGKTGIFDQASVLDLYDPDRSQAVIQDGLIRTWTAFVDGTAAKLTALKALSGEGLRILTGTVTSPSLAALLQELLRAMPKARWHQWESAGRDSARRGALQAFGEGVETRYHVANADVVVSIDSDFLTDGPGSIRYANHFASRRRVHDPADAGRMSRLYAVESAPNATGTVADHRLSLKPTDVARFTLALAAKLGVPGAVAPAGFDHTDWIDAVAEDLEAHRGACLLVAGDYADAEVHVLVHAMNAHLGNVGSTVVYTEPVEAEPVDQAASLKELVDDMNAGAVDTLVVLGANPVYDAPVDLGFADALAKLSLSVHLGLHFDETAAACQWHIPEAHYLETWSDARAVDGTVTIGQPLIEPLYGGKNANELVATLLGRSTVPADELVKEHWKANVPLGGARGGDTGAQNGSFDAFWRRALHDGVVPATQAAEKTPALSADAVASVTSAIASWAPGELELAFRPDPTVFDGRFANNGWLQELPKPLTKLTWDNALLMSPKTAREKGLGDLVKGNDQHRKAPLATLDVNGRTLTLPVWVVPGMAEGVLAVHLGYGRTRCGKVGEGAGWNASLVRTSDALFRVSSGIELARAGGHHLLASTQDHHSMEGRQIVQGGSLADYVRNPEAFHPHHHGPVDISLMSGEDFPDGKYKWGMSIDLTACTGCNACVVACQSENNIPTVGKDQVARGREMHWIRVDRYYAGEDAEHVEDVLHQPVTCMQCEQAPCEIVCPVGATTHSDEGLNDMVYNRCVGTRYCSNNCPYKVRRFNFLLYQDFETPSLQLGRNPDVTIRSRGVMEKCTYCVQRINSARITAKKEGRLIEDGEITTACQQACPSEAIVFGDVGNESSAVSKVKSSPLDYSLLEELGTRPRTTYLARVRNHNPKLAPAVPMEHQPAAHEEDAHHG